MTRQDFLNKIYLKFDKVAGLALPGYEPEEIAAIATDVPAVIALAEGTDTVFGAADVVTFVTPSTVTTGADAFDDVAISIVPVRAAAMTKLIFLNEFIFLLV